MEMYQDKTQPVEKRVEDLLSRMTLEEKAAQLCGNLAFSFLVNGAVDKDKLREQFVDGLGRFTQYSIVGLISPEHIAKVTNEVQRFFVEETRLGIPVALQSENLCGYPSAGGTIFPSMLNAAATWNPEIVEKMSKIIGEESRAVGITSAMSPVIDVSRDPRWGRTYETFGEDPYLISQMGIHYIRGMQSTGVSCIAKHFLGYAETQAGLNIAATRMNARELYEVFATPFEAADKEAGVDAMMASYSEIDGMCVGANKDIARKLLRDTMGFNGVLTSDGAAIWKMYETFHLTKSYNEAGLLAKKGGLDTEIPVGGAYRALPDYVRKGQLDEALLDESVRRVLAVKFRQGLFENPYVDEGKISIYMTNPEKQSLSKDIAKQSIILLKNNNQVLPLKPGTQLAVIGPHADSLRYPMSGYTYPAYIEMMYGSLDTKKSNQVTFQGIADEQRKAAGEKKPEGPFSNMFNMFSENRMMDLKDMKSVLRNVNSQSLAEVLSERFNVQYAKGCEIIDASTEGFADAVAAAEQSDVSIMALGGNCGWYGDVTGGEGKDRAKLDLPGVQQKLLETVAAVGKPVILLLYGPGCFSTIWAHEYIDAVLEAWLPGPYGGEAIANVLDGTSNPGGKLPLTVPRSVGQVPIYHYYKSGSGYKRIGDVKDSFAADIFVGGYVDEEFTPLYPFGFGLSYSDFEVYDFKVSSQEVSTDGSLQVQCMIKNTGQVTGAEVLQLYIRFNGARVTRPERQLAGFARVNLKEGEVKAVQFELQMAQLGYYNEDMEFVVEPGDLELMLGTSSEDILFKEKVALTGNKINVSGKRVYTCDSLIRPRFAGCGKNGELR